MPFGPASPLGIARFDETSPVELLPGRSNDEAEIVIQAVYRQVLGNAYVMESERLSVPESKLKSGEFSVREFVRQVAKSSLYQTRFFESCARYRYLELTFRHLLGRAPRDLEEMRAHSTTLDTQGFEADIDSFIDSDEYQSTFGEFTVPFLRGYKTEAYEKSVQFTHFFQLVRGASSSSLKGNLAGNKPRLNSLLIQERAAAVISPASAGAAFQASATAAPTRLGAGAGEDGKIYRIEVTAYRANVVNRVSKFRRSNKVYMVPYSQLSETYQRIHREGGVIASVSSVN